MKKIKVYCADDHKMLIKGMASTFSSFNTDNRYDYEIEMVGFGATADELIKSSENGYIDVFVIDLGFEGTKGDVAIIEKLFSKRPEANIVVYSMRKSVHTIHTCYRRGVKSYVTKNDKLEELINAIIHASKGECYHPKGQLEKLGLFSIQENPIEKLDKREQEIFMMIAQGADFRFVCNKFDLTERSMMNLITTKIKPVLGVSRTGFRDLAVKLHLIEDVD